MCAVAVMSAGINAAVATAAVVADIVCTAVAIVHRPHRQPSDTLLLYIQRLVEGVVHNKRTSHCG